jgi:hypothetical protein
VILRPPAIFLPVLLTLSCGTSYRTLPDGGRERVDCTLDQAAVAVKVVDSLGAPVEGATVEATNPGSGKATSGLTNGAGTTDSVNSTLGAGTVVITATKDQQKSAPANAQFTCGNCGCSVQPSQLVLTLHD